MPLYQTTQIDSKGKIDGKPWHYRSWRNDSRGVIPDRRRAFTWTVCLLAPLIVAAAGEDAARRFSGIGLQLEPRVGVVVVGAVALGGPADKAGVRPGDWITEVDGRPVRSETVAEVVDRLRGATGTVVKVVFIAAADNGRREAAITRQLIDPAAITWRLPGDAVVPPNGQAIVPATPAPH